MKTLKKIMDKDIQIVCISLLLNNLAFCQGANNTPVPQQDQVKNNTVSGNKASEKDQSQLYQSLSMAVLADPNSVIQATRKYHDLKLALEKTHRTGMSERNRWASKRATSYRPVLSVLHRQLKEELDLITSFATSEDANATKVASEAMLSRWNKRFMLVGKEMRRVWLEQRRGIQTMQQRRRRGRRGEINQNKPEEKTQESEATKENTYDVTPWLTANMENRKELSKSVNDELMIDFGRILAVAKKEKAVKTTLAVEAIILDRGQRFDELQKAYNRDEPGQSITTRGRNQRFPGRNRGVNNEENRPGTRRYR